MTPPIHAHYVRADQHTPETIQQVLLDLHLDDLWFRVCEMEDLTWDGAACLQLEMSHLVEGLPIMPESLGLELSKEKKSALRLSVDGAHTSVAFERFQDGKAGACWAGNTDDYLQDQSGRKQEHSPEEHQEAFRRDFLKETGLDFLELVQNPNQDEQSSEIAMEGTHVLIRGRFIRLLPGMGRWPELFRFHDRNDISAPDQHRDHVALIALDLKALDQLWRLTPAAKVTQFLRLMEPIGAQVLGPLNHALPRVLANLETLPPESPLAAAAKPSLTTVEVLAMSTAQIFMVGDQLSYLDERFFPLFSLATGKISRDAIADCVEEIAPLGILSALTEVLPYSVPEGQMMEAFADEEIAPLAPWAVEDDVYEGSLFLLDPSRLLQQLQDFDIDELRQQARAFSEQWCKIDDPNAGSVEEWLISRQELDAAELARFEDTFVELHHLFPLAALNELSPALLFYSD